MVFIRDDNVSSHFNEGVKGGNLNVLIEVPTLVTYHWKGIRYLQEK